MQIRADTCALSAHDVTYSLLDGLLVVKIIPGRHSQKEVENLKKKISFFLDEKNQKHAFELLKEDIVLEPASLKMYQPTSDSISKKPEAQ